MLRPYGNERRSTGFCLLEAVAVKAASSRRTPKLFWGEVVGVDGGVAGPLFRQVFEGEDGGYRADGDAGAAVDAFDGIDVELLFGVVAGLVFARVDAVHRADVDAGGIFCADARLGDYVSHLLLLGQIADRCLPGVYSFALKALPAKPFCLLRVTFGSSLLMIVRDEGGILNWGALRAREGKVGRLGRRALRRLRLQRLRQRRKQRHGSEDPPLQRAPRSANLKIRQYRTFYGDGLGDRH